MRSIQRVGGAWARAPWAPELPLISPTPGCRPCCSISCLPSEKDRNAAARKGLEYRAEAEARRLFHRGRRGSRSSPEISKTIWAQLAELRLDHRSGHREAGHQTRALASGWTRCGGPRRFSPPTPAAFRWRQIADGFSGAIPAAVPRHAFLQSAALPASAGSDSRLRTPIRRSWNSCRVSATCGWARAWCCARTRRISSPTGSAASSAARWPSWPPRATIPWRKWTR